MEMNEELFDIATEGAGLSALAGLVEAMMGGGGVSDLERWTCSFNNILEAVAKSRGKEAGTISIDDYAEKAAFDFDETLQIQLIHAITHVGVEIASQLKEIDDTLYKVVGPMLAELDKTLMIANVIKVAELRKHPEWIDFVEQKIQAMFDKEDENGAQESES